MKVVFEERDIPLTAGTFVDTFKPYEVHIYQGTTTLCDGSAKPPHSETLSLGNDGITYVFDEDYNFTAGVLGDWGRQDDHVCL